MRDRCLVRAKLSALRPRVGTNTCTATHTSLSKLARGCTGVGTNTRLNHPSLFMLTGEVFSLGPGCQRWARMHGFSHLVIHAIRTSFMQLMYVHASALSQRWAQILGYRHFIVSVQYVHWIVLALSSDDISTDCGKTVLKLLLSHPFSQIAGRPRAFGRKHNSCRPLI